MEVNPTSATPSDSLLDLRVGALLGVGRRILIHILIVTGVDFERSFALLKVSRVRLAAEQSHHDDEARDDLRATKSQPA